jgi:hypothetical protein
MPDWVSYGKVRASIAGVGNTIPNNISSPTQYPVNNGVVNLSPIKPLTTLKPEYTKSVELGTEWHFLHDHITFDVTLYKTNTTNQLITVSAPLSGGYSGYYLNAGNIQNKGFEGSLGYNGNITDGLKWNSTLTFSANRNKIISLYTVQNADGTSSVINRFVLPSTFDSYSLEARTGGSYGELYVGNVVKDAQGRVEVQDNGKLQVNTSDPLHFTDVGNTNPNFLLGWNNTFKFNKFDLSFLVDGRFGGTVVDMTQSYLDYLGASQATANARDNNGGMVAINGVNSKGQSVTEMPAKLYYQSIGSRQGALAEYAYSATNVRLREAAVGYTFPGSMFGNAISNLHISLTGRNLFFFYLKAPYDPDTTLSTDNGLQGIDLFGLPSVRSIGFNISAKF